MTIRLALLLLCESALLMADSRILVHEHRGARAARPENTLPAFEYAIKAGVDVLELDLAVTKDNVLVVSHDPLINADLCTGPATGRAIHELTLAEVREHDCGAKQNKGFATQQTVPGSRIPTFEEVLALASKGKFEFNVETKIFPDKPALSPPPEEFARLVFDAIHRHSLDARVIVQSFDFRTLHAMKKIAPHIRRSALFAMTTRDFVTIAKEADATIVSPYYLLVTEDRVKAAHAAGLQVIPWTVNGPTNWKRMIDDQVDGIISDDPAGLIAYMKTLTAKPASAERR